jgi:hypothetical protein
MDSLKIHTLIHGSFFLPRIAGSIHNMLEKLDIALNTKNGTHEKRLR